MLIPIHNCADYLARALPEVIAQLGERDDAEIIVVDDSSTDDPGSVVERLGGAGSGSAESHRTSARSERSTGLDLSRGHWSICCTATTPC